MTQTAEINRFKAVLESYGADPERWPAEDRDVYLNFLDSEDPAVRACVLEAREIDLVLSHAPGMSVPEGAMDRVLAKVRAEQSGQVVDLGEVRARKAMPRRTFNLRRAVPVGIAMAASLMLGVLAGLSELTATYIPGTGTITLAGLDEDTAAESLLSFEAFTLAEGDVQ